MQQSILGNKNGSLTWEIIPWSQESIFEARIPFFTPRWLILMTGNRFYILFVMYFTLVAVIKIEPELSGFLRRLAPICCGNKDFKNSRYTEG